MGEACSCTQALRASHLQFFSYPFDWLFGSDFMGRVDILCNNFENFINKEDLEFSYIEERTACNAYRNKANNITFNHDFKQDISFDEMYIKVKEKYDRRIKRLFSQIENSKRILIVFLQIPNNDKELDENSLKNIYEKFAQKFPKTEIDILYLYNDNGNHYEKFEPVMIGDNIYKIKFEYNAFNKDFPYAVNTKILRRFFRKIKISTKYMTFKNIIKRTLFNLRLDIKDLLWKKSWYR